MITVGTTVVSGSPINGGSGGGAPSGTGVVTVTSGVFDTPSSTGDIVIAGVSQLVGSDPAGTAIVSDGAGSIQPTSADVSTLLGAADAAAARAAIGATATGGESWARPSPVTAGLGATFASARDSILYLSNGTAYSSGNEQSGWSVMLPTRPGADRAGLSMPSGYCYAGGLDLSTYTTDTTTLVGLFRYTGAPSSISTLVGVMDASLTGTTGYSVYLNLNGANVDLVAYCASTATLTTLIAAVNPSVGLHAIAIAPVLVSGNYRLRVSWDGGAVVDVAAAAGSFAAPTSTSQLLFFSRSDGYQIVGAGIDLLLYKTLLSSAAMAAITAPANVAGYLLDESAGGLNSIAATHRVLAQRYDPAFATTLYARGVIGASMTLSSVSKVVY